MFDQQARAYIQQYGAVAALRRVRAERCERDLLQFIRDFWHVNDRAQPFVDGWPIEALCDHLMAVTDGHIKRLVINISPGSTKSLVSSVFWPAWEWGPQNLSHIRYIAASYSQHLTRRDNRRMRRVLNDKEYQARWGSRFQLQRIGDTQLENDKTGWKLATSIEGVGAGERGNRIVIDDPNNPNDVESETVRDAVIFWLREVMPDRLNDLAKDVIVLVQQRTHEKDATGTLLDIAGLDYVHLCIPNEYESGRHCITVLARDEDKEPTKTWEDPRGLDDNGDRLDGIKTVWQTGPNGPYEVANGSIEGSPAQLRDGELFWPARITREKTLEQKTIKGPIAYAGQYMQSPNPRGGGIIRREWWRLWTKQDFPDFIMVAASLDTAIKEKEENDYNAMTVWGIFLGEQGQPLVMLKDAWRTRTDLASLITLVGNTCVKHKVEHLLIEDKTRGHDVAAEVRNQYGKRKWSTVLLDPKQLGGDKMARLKAVQPLFSGDAIEQKDATGRPTGLTTWLGGLVYAPDMQYADEVIGEVERFPKGAHDDYCLLGETGIVTARGVVPIAEVSVGDMVMTHLGRWRRVLGKTERIADHHYRIKAKGLDEIGITGNHPMLVAQIAAPQNSEREMRGVRWEDASRVRVRPTYTYQRDGKQVVSRKRVIHDALLVPRPGGVAGVAEIDLAKYFDPGQVRLDADTISPMRRDNPGVTAIPRFVALTKEAGWCLGLFAAEGCVSKGRQVNWSCDEPALRRVQGWIEGTFDRKPQISQGDGAHRIVLSSVIASALFRDFGYLAENKVVPQWALEAPEDFRRSFVEGFAHGDGNRRGYRVALTSTSRSLLWGIRLILASLGLPSWWGTTKAAGERIVFGRASNCLAAYRLDYCEHGSTHASVSDQYIATHIETAERIDGDVIVHNISVEDDESYLTVGGLVHNCDTVSMFFLWARRWGEVKRVVEHLDEVQEANKFRKAPNPLYNV